MNPTPDPAADSPLTTLRQLKELLDTGAITPQEYDTLKQRLLFGAAPAGPVTTPAAADAAPNSVVDAPASLPAANVPATPYLDTPGALTPEATPLLTPEPDWLAAPAPLLLTPTDADTDEAESVEVAERRNPLNLVFAIGGLLLFLGVVAYLTLGRPSAPDEHLTSTSKTAADTTALAPEVGPQAEQLTLPPATAPETVRVAPAAAPLTAVSDSTAATPVTQAPVATPAPATSATPAPKAATPAPKPAAQPAPAATPAPTDTAASKP